MKLPSPLYTIVFVALLFGVDLFIYILTVYTPSVALIQFFNVLTKKFGLTISWNITLGSVIAFHALGFIIYTLIEKKLPLGRVPRPLSTSITLLIILAIFTVIAFTDLSTIVSLLYDFIDKFIVKPLVKMVSKFVVTPFTLYAIYLIVVPNLLRFLETRRVPIVQSFLVTFIVTSIVSIISLRVVNESIKIIQEQGILNVYEFGLAMIALGLVAFFEFTQFAKEMKICEATQVPAVFQIATWVIPLMENLGFSTYAISTYKTMLAFILAIVIYIHLIFIMFGFIMRKSNYITIGQAIAVAFMYVIDIDIMTIAPPLPPETVYLSITLTIVTTIALMLRKLR